MGTHLFEDSVVEIQCNVSVTGQWRPTVYCHLPNETRGDGIVGNSYRMTKNVTIDNNNDTFVCVVSVENKTNLGSRHTDHAATNVPRDVVVWTSDQLSIHTTTRQAGKYIHPIAFSVLFLAPDGVWQLLF